MIAGATTRLAPSKMRLVSDHAGADAAERADANNHRSLSSVRIASSSKTAGLWSLSKTPAGGYTYGAIEHWNDLSDQAASIMQTLLKLPPNPLGLHTFVTDFAERAKNSLWPSPTASSRSKVLHKQSPEEVRCLVEGSFQMRQEVIGLVCAETRLSSSRFPTIVRFA